VVIDLYYFPGAASLAVHAALEEAGAEYSLIRATRENGVFGPPEAARLNPAGSVPTMSLNRIGGLPDAHQRPVPRCRARPGPRNA